MCALLETEASFWGSQVAFPEAPTHFPPRLLARTEAPGGKSVFTCSHLPRDSVPRSSPSRAAPVKRSAAGRPELRCITGNLEVACSPVPEEDLTHICRNLPSWTQPAFSPLKGNSVPMTISIPKYFLGCPKLVSQGLPINVVFSFPCILPGE